MTSRYVLLCTTVDAAGAFGVYVRETMPRDERDALLRCLDEEGGLRKVTLGPFVRLIVVGDKPLPHLLGVWDESAEDRKPAGPPPRVSPENVSGESHTAPGPPPAIYPPPFRRSN